MHQSVQLFYSDTEIPEIVLVMKIGKKYHF